MRRAAWGALLLASVLAAWGCSRVEEYPPQEVDEFLRGCEEAAVDKLKDQGGSEEATRAKARQYCACAAEKVQKVISYKDFKKLNSKSLDQPSADSAPVRKMFEIVAQCQAEILGQAKP
ncbi:hypothetical protein [Fundidesulfovibrio terrae]|uniref:hypothetical protein n=1 Tax=Fundidesulfovibrio terrae TaxID=2922866 RepID=UPI001FAE99CF|nr:hypothetical protein [Fundidesulfovibrio terrae]